MFKSSSRIICAFHSELVKGVNLKFRNTIKINSELANTKVPYSTSPAANISQNVQSSVEPNKSIRKVEKKTKLVDLLNQSNTLKELKDDVKFYDPPYLNREPPFPCYELMNINIKGYDYVALGNYFEYIERICQALKVDVVEAYAVPSRSLKIKTYQPFSSNIEKEYKLNMYHRVVRIQNVKSTLLPLLFETIQLNLPEGVQLNVTIPTPQEDEYRYVPDIELDELKNKLEEFNKRPKEIIPDETAKAPTTPPAQSPQAKAPSNEANKSPAQKPGPTTAKK